MTPVAARACRMTAQQAWEHKWLQAAKRHYSRRHLDTGVLSSLRRYNRYGALKRKALEAIVFSMSSEETRLLRHAFMKMDTNGAGYARCAYAFPAWAPPVRGARARVRYASTHSRRVLRFSFDLDAVSAARCVVDAYHTTFLVCLFVTHARCPCGRRPFDKCTPRRVT